MKNITTIRKLTTTEQKSMKNIEIMKNIRVMEKTNMQKTAIEKTAMKRITATALLFFLAFFSLTTCLVAQESGQQARKQGWFVGVSPFSFVGAEIKTSRTTTTVVDTVAGAASFEYEAAIGSNFINSSNGLTNGAVTDAEAQQSLIRGAIELCRQGAAAATTDRIVDTVPLDPNSAVNSDYPTIDTRDYYIGYFGDLQTGDDKTNKICDLPASANLPTALIRKETHFTLQASDVPEYSLQGALAISVSFYLDPRYSSCL